MTFQDVYNALRTPNCLICGETGIYFFLPTATRCCRNCLYNHDTFRTVTMPSFQHNAKGVGPVAMHNSSAAVIKSLYYMYDRIKLVNYEAATSALKTAGNLGVGKGYRDINEPRHQHIPRDLATTPIPFYHEETGSLYYACRGCAQAHGRIGRMQDFLIFSFECRAYRYEYELTKDMCHTMYTKGAFKMHHDRCDEAQFLMWQSGYGARTPVEENYVLSGGLQY
ncbi:hypothetical protein GE09DRAFT_1067145 [Coniochaeta sp. 2T2.1]|nr:hypothetical protein GE09DRAFT_1067145 [Coniochaeta sp. 2T2.1]